ncbi:urease accessory protein UreD [Corynebacterium uterequi]|uniref:Urease accessory protein UreD n=1 Tax=Corynebacterium uterequi TaxID=1072256 RepID=A0A0G3HF51_9CORY|nr:urease accessory protein UreD [Corynebacterium uterequi]AKK10588.1 urease accessory protein UreH [Corynebacterium uterequi]
MTSPATGRLELSIARRPGERSYAAAQFHSGALRVMRPHYLDDSGQVTYTILNPGGAYLGADRYEVSIDVADGASLMLTTQSATKVYRTPQGPAVQDMQVTVGEDAIFEYLADPLIVYRDGSYRQRTDITVTATSRVAVAEILTPGWSPTGEPFAYDELRLRTAVRLADARPVVIDNLRILPDAATGTDADLGVMEGFTHVGQLLLIGPRVYDAVDELTALIDACGAPVGSERPTLRAGVTRAGIAWADAPQAVMIRALGSTTAELEDMLHRAVGIARAADTGRGPVRLRKF